MQHSSDMQPLVHVIINILFVLGEGSAMVRLYTKFFLTKNFGWDDWSMALVAIVNCGQHVLLYLFLSAGAGRHQTEVLKYDPTALNRMLKFLFAEEIWYLFLHFLIKMSFLLFFLRLSPSTRFRTAVHCVIAANVFVTVGTWVLYCLQCIPIDAYWSPELYPDVKCLPFAVSLWLPATALIVVDWAIFILPLSTILRLQMTMKKRLQVLAVVCTGGASVIVSCLRLIVIKEFTITTDFTYEIGSICIVSAFEIEVAILASNMPGMSAFYKYYWGQQNGGTSAVTGEGASTGPDKSTGEHQLVTFTSKRTRPKISGGGDEELLFTRQGDDERFENTFVGEDQSSTYALTDGNKSSKEDLDGIHGRSGEMQKDDQTGRVVVSREIVITDEPRSQQDNHHGADEYYQPHNEWHIQNKSSP